MTELQALLDRMFDAVPSVDSARVKREAYVLARSLVDLAGEHSERETEALETAFGDVETHFDRPDYLLVGPNSVLKELIDNRNFVESWRYYLTMMKLGHHVISLAPLPSAHALASVDIVRNAMLGYIDKRGARPQQMATQTVEEVQQRHEKETEEAPEGDTKRVVDPDEIEELLAQMDDFIGLESVKEEIRRVADRLLVDHMREQAGLNVAKTSRHLIFTGNPGTGKTTIARLLGTLYASLGVIPKGHLVETDREGLVAGYIGQTATKVQEKFDEAEGGLLLIDEAYSLARGGQKDFGAEAIDAIVKLAEDRRGRVIVVLTGYPDEMDELVARNPGMKSRFPKTVHFPDYSDDELTQIALLVTEKAGYSVTGTVKETLTERFASVPRDNGFGNGRLARNVIESTLDRHASRIADMMRSGREITPHILKQVWKTDLPEHFSDVEPEAKEVA